MTISSLGFTPPGSTSPSVDAYDSMPSVYNQPAVAPSARPLRNDIITGNAVFDIASNLGSYLLEKETEDTKPPAKVQDGTVTNNLVNMVPNDGIGVVLLIIGGFVAWKLLRR